MPSYRIELTPAADRQLSKLRGDAREMVAAAIVVLGLNPRPAGCIKLSGPDGFWRIRVRRYRVGYRIEADRLIVTVVKLNLRVGRAFTARRGAA